MPTLNSPPTAPVYNPLSLKRFLSRAVLSTMIGTIVTTVVQGITFSVLADSGLFGPRDEGSNYLEFGILYGAFLPFNMIILFVIFCFYYPLIAAIRRDRHETFEFPHIHALASAVIAGAIVAIYGAGNPLIVASFAVPLALCTWVGALFMGTFIRDGLRLTYALLGHDAVPDAHRPAARG